MYRWINGYKKLIWNPDGRAPRATLYRMVQLPFPSEGRVLIFLRTRVFCMFGYGHWYGDLAS